MSSARCGKLLCLEFIFLLGLGAVLYLLAVLDSTDDLDLTAISS
jgi:hypothetical protein